MYTMGHVMERLPLMLLIAYSLACLPLALGSQGSTKNLHATVDTMDVEEGSNLTVECNVTAKGRVYWTHNEIPFEYSKTLNIANVTRGLSGIYTCIAYDESHTMSRGGPSLQKDMDTFFLNVLYPAKILSVNISSPKLRQHDDFLMQIWVEGNPSPTTTFKSLFDGRMWFQRWSEGTYNVSIPSMNCTDTGQYILTCDNDLANSSIMEDITVLCAPEPDPEFPLNRTVKPRVGDNLKITVHVSAYPAPSYQWWFNGTQLFNHTDTDNTTVLSLNRIAAVNFGHYKLVMENEGGHFSIQFDVQADGPPDPVTDLRVSGVTNSTANLSFVTGFDYNDRQTFFIMRDLDGNLTDFRRKEMDTPGDNGGKHVILVIDNLTDSTGYSLTVLSGNSRANSTHTPNTVTFSTVGKPMPDPRFPLNTKYKPRLGDSVTLTIHARGNPMPEYYWSHNGKEVNSTVDRYNSTVVIPDVNVDSFGNYTLNIRNAVGRDTVEYEILPDGPPEPVSNLSVFGINETCAHLSFTTGYNYNRTQTFIVDRYQDGNTTVLTDCTDQTSGRGGDLSTCILCKLQKDTIYNITVVSKNICGQSPPVVDPVSFSTYGEPRPDPFRAINYTFKPRLGENVTLRMYAAGYPVPEYQWLYKGYPINSSDTGYTSEVNMNNITVKEFGEYDLIMTNAAGKLTKVYNILADGPPDGVTQLNATNATSDKVHLSWMAGFAYGSEQSFEVRGTVNQKEYTNEKPLHDSTDGNGGMESLTLSNLESSASYNICLIAKNLRGEAPKSNYISFRTNAGPSKSKTPVAEYVGYVGGGLGVLVLIIAIVAVIRRCRKGGNEASYDELQEEEDDASQRQPHHYRYDDAAAPS